MSDLDKWAAEQCGVNYIDFDRHGDFDINDARCREIVREHFKLTTDQYGDKGMETEDIELAKEIVSKVLDAAVEAGWREVHKMPDKDQRHRSIIDPIFEAINKLRGEK